MLADPNEEAERRLWTRPTGLRFLKGRYFHSGLLAVGMLNFFGPLVGLPFVTGALPQSPE